MEVSSLSWTRGLAPDNGAEICGKPAAQVLASQDLWSLPGDAASSADGATEPASTVPVFPRGA